MVGRSRLKIAESNADCKPIARMQENWLLYTRDTQSNRKTMTVHKPHDFGSLPFLGFTDGSSPFFSSGKAGDGLIGCCNKVSGINPSVFPGHHTSCAWDRTNIYLSGMYSVLLDRDGAVFVFNHLIQCLRHLCFDYREGSRIRNGNICVSG